MELARLPFFELRDGRLVLSDDSVGPIIDVHTHFALATLLPLRIDLHEAPDPTEHYLPMQGRAIDMEVYINKNFPPDDLRRMKRDLTLMGMTARGMRRTHTIPNLSREMEELGISHCVTLPIDTPVLAKNAVSTLRAVAGNERFICFGSVHPFSFRAEEKLDRQIALGARGMKIHPAAQMIRPDHPRAMRLYRLCAARNLPVLFHCGPVGIEPRPGRRRSQVVLYEQALAENPDVPFILGHSGALQMEGALGYAMRYPNAYLDVSCQSLSNVRTILEQAHPDRILYGTDWPFYHQSIALAKVLIATQDDPALRRKVLHDNAARLFGLAA
jgi:predicted TIM-barrel fold metal-dependent hydrolase